MGWLSLPLWLDWHSLSWWLDWLANRSSLDHLLLVGHRLLHNLIVHHRLLELAWLLEWHRLLDGLNDIHLDTTDVHCLHLQSSSCHRLRLLGLLLRLFGFLLLFGEELVTPVPNVD